MQLTPELTQEFVQEWIGAWNAHDVDGILEHYADEIEFTSPFALLLANPAGTIRGKEALRAYFSKAFEAYPQLRFEFIRVFTSVNSIVIQYHTVMNLQAAEMMELDETGRIVRVLAHYTNR